MANEMKLEKRIEQIRYILDDIRLPGYEQIIISALKIISEIENPDLLLGKFTGYIRRKHSEGIKPYELITQIISQFPQAYPGCERPIADNERQTLPQRLIELVSK